MKDLSYLPDTPDRTGWKLWHYTAITLARDPNRKPTHERAIVHAFDAWIEYARVHEARWQSKIGDDYVLGPAWARWGFALRELLNGDCVRLNCGTLDTILHDNLAEQGFNPEDGAP